MKICNVCRHDVHAIGKEWKCNNGCRCLMLGCVPIDAPVDVALPNEVDSALNMKMPCIDFGKMKAKLDQKRCRDCKRAFKALEPEVRVWIDDAELPAHVLEKLCNCTVINQFHELGEGECIHMKPSSGAVNR